MPHYAISMREIDGRGSDENFDAEPARRPTYLIAEDDAPGFRPDQRFTLESRGTDRRQTIGAPKWAREILEQFPKDEHGCQDGDIVFFVHGFNVDEDAALEGHRQLAAGLQAAGLNCPVISFDWPSEGRLIKYNEDRFDARIAALDLVKSGLALFAKATEPDCRIRAHFVSHSMGALVVREAIHQADDYPLTRDLAWGLSNLAFVAADIPKEDLTNSRSEALFRRAQRITNYFSRGDIALATSNVKRLGTARRLGRHGAPDEAVSMIADVDCTARADIVCQGIEGDLANKIQKSHGWYFMDDIFFRDLALTLKGDIDRRELPTREKVAGSDRLRLNSV